MKKLVNTIYKMSPSYGLQFILAVHWKTFLAKPLVFGIFILRCLMNYHFDYHSHSRFFFEENRVFTNRVALSFQIFQIIF